MKHKFNVVKVGSTTVGGGSFSVWAGVGLRGGLFKLRTDPRGFAATFKEWM